MYSKITMEKDVKKLVEDYEKYTGSDLRVQKTPGAPGTTLCKSDLEDPDNINNYRSLVGKLMWYTTKVGPDMANAANELVVQIIYTGPEHFKALKHFIGYLKFKETKGIITRKPKVLKVVMLCDLKYTT